MAAHHAAKVLKTGTPAEWVDEAQLQVRGHRFLTWAAAHIPAIPDFVISSDPAEAQQLKDDGLWATALAHAMCDDDAFRKFAVAAINTATGATPPPPQPVP